MTLTLNETFELTDIFQDYVENSALPVYAKCNTVKSAAINFCAKKMENYVLESNNEDLKHQYSDRIADMVKRLNSTLNDFNIDGVNFCNDPNIGFMIAIMVTSTKYPEEEPREAGICSGYGKLCFVYNYSMTDFSELGYCFFKHIEGDEYRIIRQG